MARLGLLFAGLSGAGKGLATGAEQDQKVADEQRLMAERSRLDEEKANRIAEAQAARTRQAGIQQGQDIGAATTNLQNQRDADAINAANSGVEGGSSMTAADAQVLRNQPAARQAYGLLNPTRQSDLEDRATAAEQLGYLDAAKETRGVLQTEITNQRNQNTDENIKQAQKDDKEWRQQQTDLSNRREDRRIAYDNAMLSYNKSRAAKADAQSEQMADRELRNATTTAMKGWETEAKDLQRQMSSSDFQMQPLDQQQSVKDDLKNAREQARTLRTRLSGAGIEGSASNGGSPDELWAILNGGKKGVTTVKNPMQQDTETPASASTRVLKTPEQIAEEDRRMEAMNRPSKGTRREEVISARDKEVASNFNDYLSLINRGASKNDKNKVLDWLSANDGSLSNMQLKQIRDARRSAGF